MKTSILKILKYSLVGSAVVIPLFVGYLTILGGIVAAQDAIFTAPLEVRFKVVPPIMEQARKNHDDVRYDMYEIKYAIEELKTMKGCSDGE